VTSCPSCKRPYASGSPPSYTHSGKICTTCCRAIPMKQAMVSGETVVSYQQTVRQKMYEQWAARERPEWRML
jgi:hypothetical protein